jgi:hypothetical protein
MDTYSWAFVAAGCIGSFIAVFHGIVTQKTMIKPILEQTDFPESTARLVPLLLQRHLSAIRRRCLLSLRLWVFFTLSEPLGIFGVPGGGIRDGFCWQYRPH